MKRLLSITILLFGLALHIVTAQTKVYFETTSLPTQSQLPMSSIHCVIQDSEGYMWYGTYGGGICRDNGYQVDVFTLGDEASNHITFMAEGDAGRIWYSTKDGLYIFDKHDYESHPVERMKGERPVFILRGRDGRMWVASRSQLFCFSDEGVFLMSYPSTWQGRPAPIISLVEDFEGRIWATQWQGGMACLQGDELQEMPWAYDSFPEYAVNAPSLQGLWVGTWGGGIVFYGYDGTLHPQPVTEASSEIGRQVISLVADSTLLWAVTMRGLDIYAADGPLLRHVESNLSSLSSNSVLDLLYRDRQGRVWVPGFTPHTFVVSRQKNIVHDPMVAFETAGGFRTMISQIAHDGDGYWIASQRLPLAYYDPLHGTTTFYENVAGIAMMTSCHGGGILMAEGKTLFRLQDGLQERLFDVEETVTAICDYGQRLLVATQNGVAAYTPNGERLSVLTSQHDFVGLAHQGDTLWLANRLGQIFRLPPKGEPIVIPEASVPSIFRALQMDARGHLWILSDQYVKEYSPASGRYRQLSISDASVTMDNFGDLTPEADGICIGGAGGLCHIAHLSSLDEQQTNIPIGVSCFVVDGQKHYLAPETKTFEVPSDATYVELHLTTFDVPNSPQVRFAYRLESSPLWIYLNPGENVIRLTNLKKGTYTVEVMATDQNGSWSQPVSLMPFHRLPAWWETWWAYTIYQLLFMTACLALVSIYVHRQRRKSERHMKQRLSELRLRFFTNISHELRTPLTLIITPLESIIKKTEADHSLQSSLKKVHHQAEELLSLVNRLLDYRKLEMGQRRIEKVSGDVVDFLRATAEAFRPMAEKKSIRFNIQLPDTQYYVYFDQYALQHVVYNLLSNALKFTSEGGNVTLNAQIAKGQLQAVISDTGIGIPQHDLQHIFERYYQAANATTGGTGIGLQMTAELLRQIGGTIHAESHEGIGSAFTFTIPLDSAPPSYHPDLPLPHQTAQATTPTILLADDNAEMRHFLANELSVDYHILQATNGSEALQIAREREVSIVVSDVMMPVMDGNELCRQLKSDADTSHLFVILLTARTGTEAELEGYQSGADAYLSKPFSVEILRNRIAHLLRLQQERQQSIQKQIELTTTEVNDREATASLPEASISPIDREFLDHLAEKADQHLAEDDYGVDQLASDLCMSRMNLYRKVQSLVGLSPSDYLRNYRLARAAHLLRTSTMPIAEIAYHTGFSTPSYFSKCFKKKYGLLPKDWQTGVTSEKA